jgi:heat shock protein HslJ
MMAKIQILVAAFTILVACQKDQMVVDQTICQTWEAKTFISLESVAYPKNENAPILLTFKEDGTFSLRLDINSCGGTFKTRNGNQIEIEYPACTEACCDSPFSTKLASMLPKVTSYQLEDQSLQLNVPQWGFIQCELVRK